MVPPRLLAVRAGRMEGVGRGHPVVRSGEPRFRLLERRLNCGERVLGCSQPGTGPGDDRLLTVNLDLNSHASDLRLCRPVSGRLSQMPWSDHDHLCPRGESPVTYMPVITSELVLGSAR